jgi:NAD(P)H-flavin reductase
VYDITNLSVEGQAFIAEAAGRDCTEEFYLFHREKHRRALKTKLIGYLKDFVPSSGGGSAADGGGTAPVSPMGSSAAGVASILGGCLRADTWMPCPLLEKVAVNHDSYRMKFGLPCQFAPLGLLPGHHLRLRVKTGAAPPSSATSSSTGKRHSSSAAAKKGKGDSSAVATGGSSTSGSGSSGWVERAFTPISDSSTKGTFELLVKVYRPCEQFKKGGQLTQLLEKLEVGSQVEITGPFGRLCRVGNGGKFIVRGDERPIQKLGLIAGGSGITPCFQLLHAIASDPDDTTEASLLYCCKTEDDLLLKEELDALVVQAAGRVKVAYVLSQAKDEAAWKLKHGHIGMVERGIIEAHIPPPGTGTFITLCGPTPMVTQAMAFAVAIGHGYGDVLCF